MAKERWEYHREKVPGGAVADTLSKFSDRLDELGDDEWELGAFEDKWAYFKRPRRAVYVPVPRNRGVSV